MMAKRGLMLLGLVLALTCGPTAVPRSPGESPTPSVGAIAASDVISLREGGQQSGIAMRAVATSKLVRMLPDGTLLPDGTTLVATEPGGASTLVKKIDRRTAATISSQTVDGTWQRGPFSSGASPDGSRLVLFGSSYNFTDASGAWTARTTFGVVDLTTWHVDTVQLDGRYGFEAISNDGRSLLVDEATPPQLPTSTRLRVYDVPSGKLSEVAGDALPSLDDSYRTPATGIGAYTFQILAGKDPLLIRFDLNGHAARTLALPADRKVQGEQFLEWSLIATHDARTLYAINPAAGVVTEIDPNALKVRRSAHLGTTGSDRGAFDVLVAAIHPVAEAKMGFGTGAVLSPDESTLYALAETGVWVVSTSSLTARLLTKDGAYESVKTSPDGKRLYVLGRETGIVSALDASDGRVLGAMERIAFPSDILAVDAG
jgi:DNA-binding beta-propeller fold protein YncE